MSENTESKLNVTHNKLYTKKTKFTHSIFKSITITVIE